MKSSGTFQRTGIAAARILGIIGLLFLAGLGVGTIVATLSSDSDAAPAVSGSDARASDGAGGLVSAGSTARFDVQSGPRPDQETPVSGGRLTPTVIAARDVGPSVVTIRVVRTETGPVTAYDQFLGRSRTRQTGGLGSGFVIDAEGHVLTNNHVVRDADQMEVVDEHGRRYAAELVGSDEITDLAVVRIEPGTVPVAPLGTSSDLVVGEPAIAIGNPSGYQLANTEPTVTSGVISGVGRDIQGSSSQEVLYADMIQTDAAINPGNSGGPLVNADGRVIGVNSSIFSISGGSEGLGFAIPIDRALRIAAEIIDVGRVRRPWVGLTVVSEESGAYERVPLIEQVAPDSPGARAGFRAGDVIERVNDREIHHNLDWDVALVDVGVNHTVSVAFRRDGREMTTDLALEEVPSARADRSEVLSGLQMVTVTPQIQQERGLAIGFGALIVDIADGVAGTTGLRRGDVIYGINGNEVHSVEDASQLFTYYARQARGYGAVRVYAVRENRRYSFDFRVGSPPGD